MSDNKSIEEYKIAIERLAKNQSDLVFNNSGIEHAAIVLSNIFKNSDVVKIYANDMNGEISSQGCYNQSINEFISRGGNLQIVLDNITNISSTLRSIINKKSAEIKISNNEFRDSLKFISKNNQLNYFAVGDNKMVRIEVDNKSHKALCSFNLPDTGKVLSNFFDTRFAKLETPAIS